MLSLLKGLVIVFENCSSYTSIYVASSIINQSEINEMTGAMVIA